MRQTSLLQTKPLHSLAQTLMLILMILNDSHRDGSCCRCKSVLVKGNARATADKHSVSSSKTVNQSSANRSIDQSIDRSTPRAERRRDAATRLAARAREAHDARELALYHVCVRRQATDQASLPSTHTTRAKVMRRADFLLHFAAQQVALAAAATRAGLSLALRSSPAWFGLGHVHVRIKPGAHRALRAQVRSLDAALDASRPQRALSE